MVGHQIVDGWSSNIGWLIIKYLFSIATLFVTCLNSLFSKRLVVYRHT